MVNYSKWDHIDDESSDDDEDQARAEECRKTTYGKLMGLKRAADDSFFEAEAQQDGDYREVRSWTKR